MIYKEVGNIKIHRLRVIHIYEADFNFFLGLKWRNSIQQAQQDGTLNQGQYGGCPGQDCTSVTYLEELQRDHTIVTRTPKADVDNDLASCYDRILPSIASLAGGKYFIDKNVIFVHAKTLKEAKYKLKISAKTSNMSYTHCIKFPIYGTGQGSGLAT